MRVVGGSFHERTICWWRETVWWHYVARRWCHDWPSKLSPRYCSIFGNLGWEYLVAELPFVLNWYWIENLGWIENSIMKIDGDVFVGDERCGWKLLLIFFCWDLLITLLVEVTYWPSKLSPRYCSIFGNLGWEYLVAEIPFVLNWFWIENVGLKWKKNVSWKLTVTFLSVTNVVDESYFWFFVAGI